MDNRFCIVQFNISYTVSDTAFAITLTVTLDMVILRDLKLRLDWVIKDVKVYELLNLLFSCVAGFVEQ